MVLLSDSKNAKLANYYHQNHGEFYIENGADVFGYDKTLEITEQLDGYRDVVSLDLFRKRIKESRGRLINPLKFQEREALFDEYFTPENAKKLIDKYPILKKEYNPDGTRKSAVQMIHDRNEEYAKLMEWKTNGQITMNEYAELHNDCKDMYLELIYKSIEHILNSSTTDNGKTYKITRESTRELQAIEEADPTIFAHMINMFKTKQHATNPNIDDKEKKEMIEYYQSRIDHITEIREGLKKLKAMDIRKSFENQGITTSEQNSAIQNMKARLTPKIEGQNPIK